MLDGGINAKRPFVGKLVIAENYRYVASYDLCVSNLYARKDARREHVFESFDICNLCKKAKFGCNRLGVILI